MPVETLTGQPSRFTAGDTVRFTVGDSRFPAGDGWTLSVTLRKGTAIITTDGSADGDNFTVAPVTTAATPPGTYEVSATYTETATSDKATVRLSPILIQPSLTNATVGPRRTAYNAARAALDAKILGDQSFSFNGQSASSYSLADLERLVDRLHIDALAEDRELGIGNVGGLVRIVTYLD